MIPIKIWEYFYSEFIKVHNPDMIEKFEITQDDNNYYVKSLFMYDVFTTATNKTVTKILGTGKTAISLEDFILLNEEDQ